MGLFSGLRDTVRKSEAAVVVQNLLEMQATAGLLDLDPAKLATQLVMSVWDKERDVFSGKFGQRPHKIAVAASALANGLSLFRDKDPNRPALVICLGNILSELAVNGRLYPLNSLDHQLLEGAATVFAQIATKVTATKKGPTGGNLHGHASFESWYAAYKRAAGEADPSLSGLLDFMENEPLERAYRDGVDPERLGREFAKHFDVRTFGLPPR